MNNETKKWLFFLFASALCVTVSSLILWAIYHFLGNTEVNGGLLTGFIVINGIMFIPSAYAVDFVFRLFEKKD